jgi:hypothetical protein
MNRTEILDLIHKERARQFDLPGVEFDVTNTPNDWIAIATFYISECTRRNTLKPDINEYKDSLVKAAAVIVAAIEYVDMMKQKNQFR